MAGYVVRQFSCLKAVTHPTTNRAQCRATATVMCLSSVISTKAVTKLHPSEKRPPPSSPPFYFWNNSVKNLLIVPVFGVRHPEDNFTPEDYKLPTSPVNCIISQSVKKSVKLILNDI